MKQLSLLFLGLVFWLSFSHCTTERFNYDLDVLQGNWRRVDSNNPDADSMLLQVNGSSGVILYAPPGSNFSNQELKWTNINSIAFPKDFTLFDKSADSTRWVADLYVTSFDGDSIMEFRLRSTDHLAAPGGEQTWVRE